jgi:hypothetical protein
MGGLTWCDSYDQYLAQVISDLQANGMIDGLDIDIWNEPDISVFWQRPQAQWIQLWGRGYHTLRYTISFRSFSDNQEADFF